MHIQKEFFVQYVSFQVKFINVSNIGRECALDILVENTAFHFFFKAFAKMGIRAEHFEQDVAATAYFNYG